MENNYNEKIVSEIKQAFVSKNRAVKSVNQLDFYLNRAKTSADRSTMERFEQFISHNGFTSLYQHATSDLTFLSENDYHSVQNRLEEITLNDEIPKSLTVLNQVEAMYRKHIEAFETTDSEYQFKQPWHDNVVYGPPKNAKTGQCYTGGNAMLLSMLQQELGLETPIFLNKHNLDELGLAEPEVPLCIGQKVVELYVHDGLPNDDPNKWLSYKRYKAMDEAEQEGYREQKVLRLFELYHASQFGGLNDNTLYQHWLKDFRETALLAELKACRTEAEKKKLFEPKIHTAKAFLQGALTQMGVPLVSHPNSCHYSIGKDEIAMVDEVNFKGEHGALAYAGVLAHEMSHSTGHKSRLARKFGHTFGSAQYAFEEVIAESSSQQLMKQFNLPGVLDKASAKYIHAWLKRQKQDANKDFLSIGCNKGQLAADYIVVKGREYQAALVEQFDCDDFRQSVKANDSKPSVETLFLAEYVNAAAIKALDHYLAERYSEAELFELVQAVQDVNQSEEQRFLLEEGYYQFLQEHYGISAIAAYEAGSLCDKFGLVDIFDNDVEQCFSPDTVFDRFNRDYGEDLLPDYLNSLKLQGIVLDENFLFNNQSKSKLIHQKSSGRALRF
ncbi:ssDNA-binding domain-containing protein [Shewanella insulae]|uniref:zincin-like metallopeptidase domain-containing protein n=1 Tax=Shewanella insulae TaxID=2681496 RepID=UPI001EFE4A5F|nr:zincin-like metallopeptidase domain-containing protein [Shewanella insulae]MCG9715001.1 ssDNA-binding domain-containing protein [Shewanella insulae]